MTRKSIVIATAGGVALVLGIVLAVMASSDPAGGPRVRGRQDPRARAEVGELAARTDDAAGRMALVQRYGEWAADGDKLAAREQIIDALLAAGDRRQGLRSALDALALDASPIADDPMVGYLASHLAPLWTDPMLYRYGRDLLLVQAADKTRVALATSLAPYTAHLTDAQDPDRQARAWMTNDLVDVYAQSGEEARPFIMAAVTQVGGGDVALALANKAGGDATQYGVVQIQAEQTEAAMRQVHDQLVEQHDPTLLNPDHDRIVDGLTRPQ
jgi:hypothetical protein